MFNNWFILAAAAGLSSALFNFVGRKSLQGGDSTAFSWFFELLRLIIFSALLIIDFKLEPSFLNFFVLVALGVTEFVSVYVFTKMHSLTELSLSSIISRLRLVWVPFFAFVLLGERLSVY